MCVRAGGVGNEGGGMFYAAAAVDAGLALHNCKCNVSGCCVMLLPLPLSLPLRSVCRIVEFRIVFAGSADIVYLACSRLLIGEYVLMLCLCVLQLENMCVICYGAGEEGEYIQCVCMFTAYYVTYCLRTVVVVVVIIVFVFDVHLASC